MRWPRRLSGLWALALALVSTLSLAGEPVRASPFPTPPLPGFKSGFTFLGGVTYDPDAQAIFNAFTTPPTTARKGLINTEVLCEKAAGSWALEDAYWFPAAADSQAATINWRNPASFTLTLINGPTFTTDRGFKGNGTTSYTSTTYNPATAGGNYVQNSASGTIYVNGVVADISSTMADIGAQDATGGLQIRPFDTAAGVGVRSKINSFVLMPGTAGVATRLGMTGLDRHQTTTFEIFRGATQLESDAAASVTPFNNVIFLGASGSNAGTPQQFSTDQIGYAELGGSLGVTIWSSRYTCVLNYLTAIGAN